MSLLDDAREETDAALVRGCAVSKMDADLRAEVEAALTDPAISAGGIERALAKRGVRIKALTLRRHINGVCSCDPR